MYRKSGLFSNELSNVIQIHLWYLKSNYSDIYIYDLQLLVSRLNVLVSAVRVSCTNQNIICNNYTLAETENERMQYNVVNRNKQEQLWESLTEKHICCMMDKPLWITYWYLKPHNIILISTCDVSLWNVFICETHSNTICVYSLWHMSVAIQQWCNGSEAEKSLVFSPRWDRDQDLPHFRETKTFIFTYETRLRPKHCKSVIETFS